MDTKAITVGLALAGLVAVGGCSRDALVGGAAVGAAAGGVYEYSNKEALEDLKDDYEDGKISKEEYQRRKRDIEKRSVVY